MTTSADDEFVLNATLLKNFSEILRIVKGQRVFLAATDREQLDLLVGLLGVVEQRSRALLEIAQLSRSRAASPLPLI